MALTVASPTTASPRDAARFLGAGVASGFLAGLLVGGVGGRLAMLVLRLTSDPALHGVLTDDDFTIGVISGETLFLLMLTAVAGTIGGVLYLAFRAWIPPPLRAWAAAVAFGAAGAALTLRPVGIDFTLLSPIPLAVAMFIALPVAFGFALVWSTERLLRGTALRRTGVLVAALAPLALLVALGGLGVVIAGAAALAWAIQRTVPRVASLWTSPAVTWVGRGLLTLLTGWFLLEVVRDTIDIVR